MVLKRCYLNPMHSSTEPWHQICNKKDYTYYNAEVLMVAMESRFHL